MNSRGQTEPNTIIPYLVYSSSIEYTRVVLLLLI